MSSLANTINTALAAVGPATEDRMRGVMADFNALHLNDEERLFAVASAIAATAQRHHARHASVYLDAVKSWAVEIADELRPPPPRFGRAPDHERVEEAAEVLISGIDALIELMTEADTRMQDRLVTELALLSRLLGENDANTIHLAMIAVGEAVGDLTFRAGDMVAIPLRDTARPLTRDACLERLIPRGFA